MKIICICGKKRSGKDTVSNMIKSIKPSMSYALAYPIKVGLAGGFDGVKVSIDGKLHSLTYDDFDGNGIDREQILNIEFKQIAKSLSLGFNVLGKNIQETIGAKKLSILMSDLLTRYNVNNGFSIRDLLKIFGTDIGVNYIDVNIWLKYFTDVWLDALSTNKYEYFIVSDIRQQHEINVMRTMNADVIHIENGEISDDDHITERCIEKLSNESSINNNKNIITLDQLYENVKQLINERA